MSHSNAEIFVLDKKVKLLQPEDGFRTSFDSIMLAAACPVKTSQKVLDMGCGVGGVSFCILERVKGCSVVGVEIQASHVALANKNIEINQVTDRAEFIHSDILDFKSEVKFNHVVCNPPYLEGGEYLSSPKQKRAKAMGDKNSVSVSSWIDKGFRLLKSGGTFTMIHRSDYIDKILFSLAGRFGAIEIIPLWPKIGKESKRVIVRAVKDRKTKAKISSGIVIHEENGSYTAEADAILRGKSSI
jgi:tRNA1(Val) A37 N6-methylase TrmN6